jgi:hypothetical protein
MDEDLLTTGTPVQDGKVDSAELALAVSTDPLSIRIN